MFSTQSKHILVFQKSEQFKQFNTLGTIEIKSKLSNVKHFKS